MEAVRPMFPFLWLFFFTTIWAFYSRNNVLSLEPRIMFILFGTLFSNIAVSNQKIKAGKRYLFKKYFAVSFNCSANVWYPLWRFQYTHVAPGSHCGCELFSMVWAGDGQWNWSKCRKVDCSGSDNICDHSSFALWTWIGGFCSRPFRRVL